MGVATTAAPYGFWATNPTKKLAQWVYLLGQPLSRNHVFQNFSGEPPPLILIGPSFIHTIKIVQYTSTRRTRRVLIYSGQIVTKTVIRDICHVIVIAIGYLRTHLRTNNGKSTRSIVIYTTLIQSYLSWVVNNIHLWDKKFRTGGSSTTLLGWLRRVFSSKIFVVS